MTLVRHMDSHGVNYNYTVFLLIWKDFIIVPKLWSAINVVMFGGFVTHFFEGLIKHSVMCSMKSESLALPFSNKEYVHRLQCTKQ